VEVNVFVKKWKTFFDALNFDFKIRLQANLPILWTANDDDDDDDIDNIYSFSL